MKDKTLIRLITLFMSLGIVLVGQAQTRVSELSQAQRDLGRFAARSESWVARYWLNPEAQIAVQSRVDEDRRDEAIRNSAAWIRAIVKPEFVPKDLEPRIESIAGGLEKMDANGVLGKGQRYDCTTVSFDAQGYRFVITQDSTLVAVFVTDLERRDATAEPTPEKLVGELRERVGRFFQHASASFYLRAVRLIDLGVELVPPPRAWYSDEKRWRSTVLVPPKACVDGVMDPTDAPGFTGSSEVGKKLREVDPTLPANWTDSDITLHWWASVYAATNGKVLVYTAAKTAPGQCPTFLVPDWFRIAEPGEFPENTEKAGQTRATGAQWPPQ